MRKYQKGIRVVSNLGPHAANFGLHNKVIRKTSDETVNNSAVLQADDELLWAVGANETWVFDLYLLFNSSTVADLRVNMTEPSGVGFIQMGGNASVEHADQLDTGRGADTYNKYSGVVKNGATPGNVVIVWAQQTQEATDTKVLTGSTIIATRVV